MAITGILLAAGRGRRFDPSGAASKLMAPMADGTPVAAASAGAMLAALPRVVAVVADGAAPLAALLAQLGCEVTVCADAHQGMAASLAHGVRHSMTNSDGWIIGLADMPYVQAATVRAVAAAVARGADIAVPMHGAKRGNPVGFSRHHTQALLSISGDQGARDLLRSCPVVEVEIDDAGILRDIDLPSDLA